jgi:phage terminase small subunit
MPNLTAKQAPFIDEYMVSLNGTQAAIRAGYSRKTARAIASESLRKPETAAETARRRRQLNEKFEGLIFRVIEQLCHIAYANYGDVLDPKWTYKPLREWPPEFLSAVKSMKYSEKLAPNGPPGKRQRIVDQLNIKTYHKLFALGLLGEFMGIFPRGSARKRRPKSKIGFVAHIDRH